MNGISGSGFSGAPGESSATSAPDVVESPPLSAFKTKRRHSRRKRLPEKRLGKSSQSTQQRYWNEFDDGSEGSGNEAYTIFVDPDASSTFPGMDMVSNFFIALASKINAAEHRATHWLRPSGDLDDREHEPLINGDHTPSIEDSDMSDPETSPDYAKPRVQGRYATFPSATQAPAIRARESLLFRSCLASFAASIVLLVVAAILETTGRRKAETTVDAGVIIGVASSLVFAIIAVGSMVGRRDNVGWIHRAVVLLMFLCIALGGGGLLAALSHA